MRVAVYGGCFNPPHLGHRMAARAAWKGLKPDRLLILPDQQPPHKAPMSGEPSPEERMELCRLAFRGLPGAELSDLSYRREGPSYMADTMELLRAQYPDDELILILGADMLPGIETWHAPEKLLRSCSLAVLTRDGMGERELAPVARRLTERWGVKIRYLENKPKAVSSAQLRQLLPARKGERLVSAPVYREIIRHRYYHAQVSLSWLRRQVYRMLKPSRIPHVAGCEKAARALAERWGEDPDTAAEAAILHDMTKRWSAEEQLRYCAEHEIDLDETERNNPQLLHARTGAVAAKELFGASDRICQAVRWHTTGKPDMNLLEKILYLADVIEETRSYPGVEDLRALCFQNLEAAMGEAARRCLENIRKKEACIHEDTVRAYRWYCRDGQDKGGENHA